MKKNEVILRFDDIYYILKATQKFDMNYSLDNSRFMLKNISITAMPENKVKLIISGKDKNHICRVLYDDSKGVFSTTYDMNRFERILNSVEVEAGEENNQDSKYELTLDFLCFNDVLKYGKHFGLKLDNIDIQADGSSYVKIWLTPQQMDYLMKLMEKICELKIRRNFEHVRYNN